MGDYTRLREDLDVNWRGVLHFTIIFLETYFYVYSTSDSLLDANKTDYFLNNGADS